MERKSTSLGTGIPKTKASTLSASKTPTKASSAVSSVAKPKVTSSRSTVSTPTKSTSAPIKSATKPPATSKPTPAKTSASLTIPVATNVDTYEMWCKTENIDPVLPSTSQWLKGPINTDGKLFDASNRNILCMDIHPNGTECVIGGADHGLKVFDIESVKQVKELYTKKYGHTEWVTCVSYLPNGKIVSGAMDSKLCVWDEVKIPRCRDLLGHRASISCVKTGDTNKVAISGSYDKTAIVWNLTKMEPFSVLSGHKEAIVDMRWVGPNLVTGDRGGSLKLWDIPTCTQTLSLSAHKTQINALEVNVKENIVLSGSLDEARVYDLRTGNLLEKFNSGPVNCVGYSPQYHKVIVAGGNRKIYIYDDRTFKPLLELTDHKDYIYSMKLNDKLIFSGGGNGWLLAHDMDTGKCLYGLGANEHAVRCIGTTPSKLVASGDDGKALVYDF